MKKVKKLTHNDLINSEEAQFELKKEINNKEITNLQIPKKTKIFLVKIENENEIYPYTFRTNLGDFKLNLKEVNIHVKLINENKNIIWE